MSSQIWCYLKFPLQRGKGGVPPKKVPQNCLKHVLVLEFLRSDEIFLPGGGGSEKLTTKQPSNQADRHYSDQISRSALRDGATKNQEKKKCRLWTVNNVEENVQMTKKKSSETKVISNV